MLCHKMPFKKVAIFFLHSFEWRQKYIDLYSANQIYYLNLSLSFASAYRLSYVIYKPAGVCLRPVNSCGTNYGCGIIYGYDCNRYL